MQVSKVKQVIAVTMLSFLFFIDTYWIKLISTLRVVWVLVLAVGIKKSLLCKLLAFLLKQSQIKTLFKKDVGWEREGSGEEYSLLRKTGWGNLLMDGYLYRSSTNSTEVCGSFVNLGQNQVFWWPSGGGTGRAHWDGAILVMGHVVLIKGIASF